MICQGSAAEPMTAVVSGIDASMHRCQQDSLASLIPKMHRRDHFFGLCNAKPTLLKLDRKILFILTQHIEAIPLGNYRSPNARVGSKINDKDCFLFAESIFLINFQGQHSFDKATRRSSRST